MRNPNSELRRSLRQLEDAQLLASQAVADVNRRVVTRPPEPVRPPTPAAPVKAPITRSPEQQRAHREFIQKMIDAGLFTKVESIAGMPRVWVTAKFMVMQFSRQEKVVSAVYAYCFDGSRDSDIVVLIDSMSGTKVGVYGRAHGGLKMQRR